MVFSSSSKVTFGENIQDIVIINSDTPEVVITDDDSPKNPEWWEISGENKL